MANEQTNQSGADLKRIYKVYDSNQRGAVPRVHEVIITIYEDGREPDVKQYQLYSAEDKPCEMEQAHAYKFLHDAAFRVINPKGDRVAPINKFDPSKPLTELKDNELVVTYEELNRDALFKRCKLIPGSDDLHTNSSIPELAAFMVKWRKSLKGMTEGDRAISEAMAKGGYDSVGVEGLDKMFGERKAA